MTKSTDIEIRKRISIVAEMIIKGYSREKIIRYASENWKISERQTDTYIKRAHETFIHEAQSKNVEQHLNASITRLQDLYNKCYLIQDYAECRRILNDIADLVGAKSAIKHEHQGIDLSPLRVEIVNKPSDD